MNSEDRAPRVATLCRNINAALGHVEHALLALFLAVLVGCGAAQAVARYAFGTSIQGSEAVIQSMVYFLAMTGAALAAQRLRMISMDVLARVLPSRPKIVARLLVAMMVLFVCFLLVRAGWQAHTVEPDSDHFLSSKFVVLALPVGGALIALHYLLHAAIDISYLALGRTPPEEDHAPAI